MAEQHKAMKHTHLQKIITLTALIFVMAFIFYMSAQPGDDSSGMSRRVCEVICQTFVPDYKTMTVTEQDNLISGMEFWVRKCAHCFEYMILGILIYLTADLYVKRTRRIFLASLAAGIIYAAGDELHQYFVPGRSCQLRDVMIDSIGVLIGISLMHIIKTIKNNKPDE